MIRLLIMVPDPERREHLQEALLADPEIAIVGAGADFEQATQPNPQIPDTANISVVDLAHPEAASHRLWSTIHTIYPEARLIGMVEQPIDEAVLQATVHAGVYAFVEWTASTAEMCSAVRMAHAGEPYLSPVWVLLQMQELFTRLNLEAQGIVQVGALQLKLAKRQAYLGNQRLPLTCLEFDVLLCLAHRVGYVVTHDELLHKAWGCDLNSGGTINQVNCCIKRLRRKLGSDGPTYVITVRGIGYRMLTETEWRVRMRKS